MTYSEIIVYYSYFIFALLVAICSCSHWTDTNRGVMAAILTSNFDMQRSTWWSHPVQMTMAAKTRAFSFKRNPEGNITLFCMCVYMYII